MCVEFISCSYFGDVVESQTRQGTEELLKLLLDSEEEKSALNTYRAMKELEMSRETCMHWWLSMNQVCRVHAILMQGLHRYREVGKIRNSIAYTKWKGLIHAYPGPDVVMDKLIEVIDRHNIYIRHLSSLEKLSKEEVEHVFKCAACLLFDFVNTRLFSDGNGRMCRLLANYVVSLITPFPVCLYDQKRCGHTDYIEAIVQCQDNREKGSREIAAMLVEGVWNGWTRFFSFDHNKLGSFVMPACAVYDTQQVAYKVGRIFEARKCELNVEKATQRIVQVVKAIDLKNLGPCSHIEVSVEVEPPDKRYITIEVFK